MNCYEWRHQLNVSGMKISCNASWQTTNDLLFPPETVTLASSGETQFTDITPPDSRRGIRCNVGYTSGYARRSDWQGYGRFNIYTLTGPTGIGVEVTSTVQGESSIISSNAVASQDGSFVSGMYEPWIPNDPSYVCAKGIWTKSTEFTKNNQLSLRGWISGIPWPTFDSFPANYLGGFVLNVIYHREVDPFTADVLLDFNLRGELAKISDGAQITWKFFNIETQEYINAGTGSINYDISQA